MGIMVKQSIKNTIYSYIGILLGAVYTIFLVPKVFSHAPEELGLIQLINSYVLMFMPFALMGFPNIIIKYWPEYREKQGPKLTFFLIIVIYL